MAKYKEASATGSTWMRCKTLVIENTLNAPPTAFFTESRVTEVGGATSEQYAGGVTVTFDPAAGVVALRNPETGELTGTTASHAELYVILYSLYMQAAMERDAAASLPAPV